MPAFASRLARLAALVALGLTTTLATIDTADARRAGGGGSSFGSRGSKTFAAPAPTRTAPGAAAPVERSMTPRPAQSQQAAPNAAGQQRNGMFGNFGRSMLGGLLVGGLLGMMLGNGFGGMAGMLGMLLQVALIGGLIMLAMRFFANRNQPAASAAGAASLRQSATGGNGNNNAASGFRMPNIGGGVAAAAAPRAPLVQPLEIDGQDFDRFEQLLSEVQAAYSREDYAALRRIATPEAMSYLAEEMGENATNGVKNEVSDVKLLQGDLSEAWSEDGTDYATVAIRYESIDVMRNRETGAVVEGNASQLSESTEIWTFARKRGSDWLLSAIQAVA